MLRKHFGFSSYGGIADRSTHFEEYCWIKMDQILVHWRADSSSTKCYFKDHFLDFKGSSNLTPPFMEEDNPRDLMTAHHIIHDSSTFIIKQVLFLSL